MSPIWPKSAYFQNKCELNLAKINWSSKVLWVQFGKISWFSKKNCQLNLVNISLFQNKCELNLAKISWISKQMRAQFGKNQLNIKTNVGSIWQKSADYQIYQLRLNFLMILFWLFSDTVKCNKIQEREKSYLTGWNSWSWRSFFSPPKKSNKRRGFFEEKRGKQPIKEDFQ